MTRPAVRIYTPEIQQIHTNHISDPLSNPFSIAYYLVTDIQHIPPIIGLFPYLGGIVITKNLQIYDFIKNKYAHLAIPCYYVSRRRRAHKLLVSQKIRTVIYPSYHTLYRGNAVQIFHGGLSDKNYVESVKILPYDLVLFPGEKTRDKVARSGYLKWIPKWDLVGYPKFDPMVTRTVEVQKLFSNNRKTILYAPTWVSQNERLKMIKFSKYGESSLHIWAKDIITQLHVEYNIIIKYHSRIYRQPGDIYEEIDNLIKTLGASDVIKVAIDDNILPFMAQADLMISDMSTACYEWFHFDKPIVFANPSPENYKPSDDISSNTYAWQAGDVINESQDILQFVRKNLVEDFYREKRNEIFKYAVFKPDGKATERQAQAIIEFTKRFERMPYWWLLISAWIRRRSRRTASKVLNRYYRLFKKSKIGK